MDKYMGLKFKGPRHFWWLMSSQTCLGEIDTEVKIVSLPKWLDGSRIYTVPWRSKTLRQRLLCDFFSSIWVGPVTRVTGVKKLILYVPNTPWDCHICRPIDPSNHPN